MAAMSFSSGSLKSGMMEIGIALVLHDRFSNQAAQASGVIRRLQNDAQAAVRANLTQAYNFGTMGLGAFQQMASGISSMIQYGAEFVDTMTTVEAITTATTEQMGILKDTAMSLGKQTMFSSQDVASGMKYLAMAGNTAEQIEGMIRGATFAAGATGMALGGKGGAADVITNVMRTFQLEGEKNAMWVGDVMTNATLSANISMQDLAASIRYAAADMTNLGYTLPEVSAAIGTLGNMGIQGSMAGTALANMARYLNKSISDPSFKGNKFLQQVGLSKEDLVESNGNLKSLYSIMKTISDATANMEPTEKNLFTTGVFGVRGNRAAMAIMRDLEGFKRLYEDVGSTTPGFAQAVVEKRMSTVAGQLNAMKSTWENLKASFTEALAGFLIPVFKTVTKWLDGTRKFLSTGIGRLIARLGLIGTALLGLASTVLIIRSRVAMLQLDSQVTGKNMFAVLVGGWRGATVAAMEYAQIQQLIINQQKAGIMGNAGVIALASGYKINGYTATPYVTATGKTATRFRDASGRFVSKSTALAGVAGAGAATTTAAVMGKGLSAATKVGGKLLSIGGKLFRLFGGWVGLAITGLSIILPLIFNAISKHKDATNASKTSTDDNTIAVNGLNGTLTKKDREEAAKANLEKQELTMMVNLLGQLVRGQKDKQITVNIKTPNGIQSFSSSGYDTEEEMFEMNLK